MNADLHALISCVERIVTLTWALEIQIDALSNMPETPTLSLPAFVPATPEQMALPAPAATEQLAVAAPAAAPAPANTVIATEAAAPAPAQFNANSKHFNSTLSKEERHTNGIYFTPKAVQAKMLELLARYGVNPSSALEPSSGTGEFVYAVAEKWPSSTITAVEKHEKLSASLKSTATITSVNADFLNYSGEPVDLVIGNPPFFVTKIKNSACMTGRGNMYVLFLYKCLTQHLKKDGVLGFVLPTSFLNSLYYEPCRKYIATHTTVLCIESLDAKFYDTAQDTMLLLLKNTPPTGDAKPYVLDFAGSIYLNKYYKELSELTGTATTVSALGLSVKTGEVVWNEHKSALHATNGTLVIYQSNLDDGRLVLDNLKGEKKQRIVGLERDPVVGPALCIGRGYGNTFKLIYGIVPAGTAFYGENHVNVVTGPAAALERLQRSLTDPRTADFIRMFVGNGALSKSEIAYLLPVF
jgi:translation initiation factor 2 beta subunit (eIF-2beta)/eIF-5